MVCGARGHQSGLTLLLIKASLSSSFFLSTILYTVLLSHVHCVYDSVSFNHKFNHKKYREWINSERGSWSDIDATRF